MKARRSRIINGNPADGMIGENFSSMKFSAILCDFWAVTPEQLRQLFKHVWRREFSEDEIFHIGERIWNLGRLFNLREGVEPDTIPAKLYVEEGVHGAGPRRARPSARRPSQTPCRSSTACAAGTSTACPARPSWPNSTSTSASDGRPVRKGHRMPHVMISSKKCTGCHMCELACSAWHEGAYRPSVAGCSAEVNPTTAAVKGHTCLQTACAKCEEVCPEQAIYRKAITVTPKGEFDAKAKAGESVAGYVLVVDEESAPTAATATTSAPRCHPRAPGEQVAYKCDLCDGEPQCIAFCQNPHVLAVDLKVDKADRALVEADGCGSRTHQAAGGLVGAGDRGTSCARALPSARRSPTASPGSTPQAAPLPRRRQCLGRCVPQRAQHSAGGLDTALNDGDEIKLLPPIAGG